MVSASNASHIGSALSIADIIAILYEKILNYNYKKPSWENRDRFILSKGHACVAVYAAWLARAFLRKKNSKPMEIIIQNYEPYQPSCSRGVFNRVSRPWFTFWSW